MILAWWISRGLAKPVRAMTRALTRLAQGNVDEVIPGKGRQDEIGAMAIAADVFKQNTLEREVILQEKMQESLARREAEAASHTKSIFLANMSHELRTPLNSILGFSRLMRVVPDLLPNQAENLNIIIRSGEHLLNLINNILDISKIEAGRVEREESNTDLHHLLHEILSLLNVQAIERGLSFQLVTAPDLPRQVVVDATKLRQVLTNLVGNAIKFTVTGEVVLRAGSAGRETAAGTWLRFAVEDTGPGISIEDQKRLFTPFVQISSTASAKMSGSGLGLVISRQFVELMHGTLAVRSAPGAGAEFWFEIPVQPGTAPETTDAGPKRRVIGLAAGQPHYHLLVAEDQAENRLLLHRLLEPLGFELCDAHNGREAVDQFETWLPDLVFMDIRMPVMDGMEATRRIRSGMNGTKVPIVALTAHALEAERLEILAAGCNDFVRKPYREGEIFAVLSQYLGVQFDYGEPIKASLAESAVALDAARLQRMPPELLEELLHAVELLNNESCLITAGRISDLDPVLGQELRRLIEGFHFQELLDVLEPRNQG